MKGNTYFIALVYFFSILFSCTNHNQPQTDAPLSAPQPELPLQEGVKQANEKWLNYSQKNSDSIQFLYTEKSVKVLSNGQVLEGKKAIAEHQVTDSLQFRSIRTKALITANEKQNLHYEVGEITDTDGTGYKYLTIWKISDLNYQKEFEIILEAVNPQEDVSTINDRRQLWIELCNKHNATALIDELYTANTLYYNHKPLVVGRTSLYTEYNYMNNEKYQLTLSPILVEGVNQDFIFEIGQCSGSYQGKYILIWRKDEDGVWRIHIDSNV